MATPGASSALPVIEARAADQAGRGSLLWQQASIAAIARQTPRVKSFFFAPTDPFSFRAGQHVDVRLTAPDGYRAERSYSIASAPDDGSIIELAIERLDDGEVSTFFHDVAVIGDAIELRGPIGGHFVWEIADGGPLLLLAGGSGVVPLMSMIRHRALQGSTIPTLLLYSVRVLDEIIFRDELFALHQPQDGLELVFALTREPPRRKRDYGRRVDGPMVRELLSRLPGAPQQTFICGANPFVEAAADSAIAAGIAVETIRTERYGG
jgi:ferredoxin-NADP reductase